MKTIVLSISAALLLGGCVANKTGTSPSQNTTLQAVSANTAASAKGGVMQRSLDEWLKETWDPAMATEPTENTKHEKDGSVVTTKTEPTRMSVSVQTAEGKTIQKMTNATQITTTTKAPDGTVTTKTEIVPLDDDNEPFTLQKYVDKWKTYLDKKEKLKEGQPKEPSHYQMMQSLPGIGK